MYGSPPSKSKTTIGLKRRFEGGAEITGDHVDDSLDARCMLFLRNWSALPFRVCKSMDVFLARTQKIQKVQFLILARLAYAQQNQIVPNTLF